MWEGDMKIKKIIIMTYSDRMVSHPDDILRQLETGIAPAQTAQ